MELLDNAPRREQPGQGAKTQGQHPLPPELLSASLTTLPTKSTKLSQFKVEKRGLWGSFQSLFEKILHFHSLEIREYEAGSLSMEGAPREKKVVGVFKVFSVFPDKDIC